MVALPLYNEVKKNTYFDSITLMLFSGNLSGMPGVEKASVMMGTEHNKSIMSKAGVLSAEKAAQAGPNDMLIGILASDQASLDAAVAALQAQMDGSTAVSEAKDEGDVHVRSLDGAVKALGEPNFAVVSVPGKYAAGEAMKVLHAGMHCLLFSDNVTLEDEIRLKRYAVEHELLLMGPDCGTTWVNGTAFGFANKVRRGDIGLVAASGTGLQEVCVIIDLLGGGISQALGTGGRDVKESVGGLMMLAELQALEADPMTKVIGIVSKPPADSVLEKIIDLTRSFTKPVVACFLGGNRDLLKGTSLGFANTMEDAARMLVELSTGIPLPTEDDSRWEAIAAAEIEQYTEAQRYVRGLYSGGSLCYEGILLAEAAGGRVYSNIADDDYRLTDPDSSTENTYIDMGEDYFTDGMPHPMIDTRLREERLIREAQDESVAVIVLDCVLGYGSNADPAGALAGAIKRAGALNGGRHITYIVSCCGTYEDFQDRAAQEETLRAAGAIVCSCNAQSAALAALLLQKRKEDRP